MEQEDDMEVAMEDDHHVGGEENMHQDEGDAHMGAVVDDQRSAEEAPMAAYPLANDPTMAITPTEREWALRLKHAVEESETLESLTDFQYAQYMMVSNGNLEDALMRVERMQIYKQEYGVHGTAEQGLLCLAALMDQQPGFLLHLDEDPVRQASVHAVDLGSLKPEVALGRDANGKDNWRTFTCGMYYIFHACQPTLAAIRNGFYALVDFGNITWENYSPECQQKLFGELVRFYPFTWTQFLAYNTGHVANIKLSLARRLMPESMRNSIQYGCKIFESDETRNPTAQLKDFYLLPCRLVAEAKVLILSKHHLDRRAYNEKHFRL